MSSSSSLHDSTLDDSSRASSIYGESLSRLRCTVFNKDDTDCVSPLKSPEKADSMLQSADFISPALASFFCSASRFSSSPGTSLASSICCRTAPLYSCSAADFSIVAVTSSSSDLREMYLSHVFRKSPSMSASPAKLSSMPSWNFLSESSSVWCCECMSSRCDETEASTCNETGQSLMNALERPERLITRRTSRDPPSHSAPLSSTLPFNCRSLSPISNPASITQLSALSPITETSAFAPQTIARAPIIMDFPAPVCPVTMTSPSGKSISRESIST